MQHEDGSEPDFLENNPNKVFEFDSRPELFMTKKLEWDVQGQFIVCYSNDKLNIIEVIEGQTEVYNQFNLKKELYSEILDVQIDSGT